MKKNKIIEGLIPLIERRYQETSSSFSREYYASYLAEVNCPVCNGKRLSPMVLSVLINHKNIHDFTEMSISESLDFVNNLVLNEKEAKIAELIIREIKERLSFLKNVGLDYLTLSRKAGTLSGGEAQRIRLATQIGSKLTGVLYVLDEPSIGLHQRDNHKLIEALKEMRDLGNTLIVVEHDEETMLNADYLVDIGPGAGVHGGQIVASGTPSEVMLNKDSITAKYLRKELYIEVPKQRSKGNGKFIEIFGAKENNLKNINVKIPCGAITCVTGVSGSGKSSLVNEVLYKNMYVKLYKAKKLYPGKVDKILGTEHFDRIIDISQSPIGRTPRSNPATYTGVFDDIRDLFAKTNEARARGYDKGRFSFNVKGGRCEACWGDGVKKITMNFLPDVYVKCEVCEGTRYNRETLEVKYNGKTIADVLEMTIEDALVFFENHLKIKNKLQALYDVGLGYLKLGQSSTELSGGEAQRIKLASELQSKISEKTLYILDEPTTGLHIDDIKRLMTMINRLREGGATVIIIEHNLDVIKLADYIVDLGPCGGELGGNLLFEGTPEDLVNVKESATGEYLKAYLMGDE
jgi:excinuclease ABC subunit A